MSLSNQIFDTQHVNGTVETALTYDSYLYSDQLEQESIVFSPVSGGGVGDRFTVRFRYRKIGHLVYLDLIPITPPSSATGSPNWSTFVGLTNINARYRPAIFQQIPITCINAINNFYCCLLNITSAGEVSISNDPSSTNFTSGITGLYSCGIYQV